MARQRKEEEQEEQQEDSLLSLSKSLIKELNKNSQEKLAWCLATDHDDPTSVKEFVPTGSTLLDYIITNRRGGGVPVGKLTEIVGEEASGKSLLLTQILANTQKKGGLAVLIDTENALNPLFAERVGLDLTSLVYIQCGTVEEVGETIEKVITMARAKDVKRIITIGWDSVAATPPKAELEGDYDPNSRVGLQAKAIAKMMRKLTQTVGRDRITLVFTNQMKVKIGVMFGDPMGTPGGKAIPYHASVRVRLNRSSELKNDDKSVFAVHTKAKVIKGRLGPPLRTCEFDIHFSDGVDDKSSIRDLLWQREEIEKRAGWMVMKNIPSDLKKAVAKLEMVNEAGEMKFRAAEFAELMEIKQFKDHVFDLLDKQMIVSFDAKTAQDVEMDSESLMDVEAVAEMSQESA